MHLNFVQIERECNERKQNGTKAHLIRASTLEFSIGFYIFLFFLLRGKLSWRHEMPKNTMDGIHEKRRIKWLREVVYRDRNRLYIYIFSFHCGENNHFEIRGKKMYE